MARSISCTLLRAAVASLSLGVASGVAHTLFAQGETLDTIVGVWRERERETKTVQIELAESFLTGKGSILGGPPKDIVSDLRCVLIIDGQKIRYERIGEVWTDVVKSSVPETMIAVFDGKVAKVLSQRPRNDDVLHSLGWIRKSREHPDVRNSYLAPALWHYRPLSPSLGGFHADQLKLVKTDALVDGRRCLLLEERKAGKPLVLRNYWVDPERDMSIVRLVRTWGQVVDHQCDISYQKDPKDGWRPIRWKAISFGDEGKVLHSGEDAVTDCNLNVPIPASSFEIDFPPGTEVFDRVNKRRFLVTPDGSEREILRRELNRKATYSELMQTEVGFAGQGAGSDENGRVVRLVMVTGVLLVAVASLIAFMRSRRNMYAYVRRRP